MQRVHWKILIGNWEDKTLFAAVALVLFSFFGAVARAEVISVEQLTFSRLQLLGSNELEVTQTDENTLKIRGDSDDLSPPPFVLQGDMLLLGITASGDVVKDVKFKLTATGFTELLLQGPGDMFVKPLDVGDLLVSLEGSGAIRMFDIKARDLEIRVVGSGDLQAVNVIGRNTRLSLKGSGDIQLGSLTADSVKAHLAGSGDIGIENDGAADELEVGMMGSGDISMKRLMAREAKVTIMGSGDVEIWVEELLDAEIFGSGDLLYTGQPKTSTSVMGSGDITQEDGQ